MPRRAFSHPRYIFRLQPVTCASMILRTVVSALVLTHEREAQPLRPVQDFDMA